MSFFILWNSKDDIMKHVSTVLVPIDFQCVEKKKNIQWKSMGTKTVW